MPGTILQRSHIGTRFVLRCAGEICVLQRQDLQCGQISTAWFYFLFPCKSASSPCFSSEIAGKPSAWQLWVRRFQILWRSHSQARIVGSGSSSGQRNRNSTTLFWLWFASYESDDQMISHHCYIRNIRSLLRKLLKQVVSER